jgi:signal transduction histidine kinase
MYFGGLDGFVRFHPDSIKDNPYIPPIVITGFRKSETPLFIDSIILHKNTIELKHEEDAFSFEFVSLSYMQSGKNQYAYKLEGYDKEWNYCGVQRYANYKNVNPGTYIFRVKGSNNDGVWNEEGTSIAVIITPPFWATWWFRGFVFIALLVSVGGSVRYVEKRKLMRRIEQLENERAIERERARISQDMHDEVGSSLSEIAILSELGRKRPEEAETRMREISDRASELIDNVSEIVWAMNPKNDTLDNLVAHLRRYAVKYLSLAQINCKFTAPDVIPAHHLTAEVRRNLFLVVKEALHNVVKHAGASEVSITATLVDARLEINIEDNGKGFCVEGSRQFGNGLTGMDKRMTDIGGEFKVESTPDGGTRVEMGMRLQVMGDR